MCQSYIYTQIVRLVIISDRIFDIDFDTLIYTDDKTSLLICCLFTTHGPGRLRSHLPFTTKTGKSWRELVFPVILVYNNKEVHRVTKMTPVEAMNKAHQLEVRVNLEINRKHSRLYPTINVGDTVKIYKKKDKLDKERVSVWGDKTYTVQDIQEFNDQKLYNIHYIEQYNTNKVTWVT